MKSFRIQGIPGHHMSGIFFIDTGLKLLNKRYAFTVLRFDFFNKNKNIIPL